MPSQVPIINDEVQGVFNQIGALLDQIEIPPEFFDPNQQHWKNTNNHVMLMWLRYYMTFEDDPNVKVWLYPLIKHLTFLYVMFPQYRQRLGWAAFWFNLYITDRQFQEERGEKFQLEMWCDPRHWNDHIPGDSMQPVDDEGTRITFSPESTPEELLKINRMAVLKGPTVHDITLKQTIVNTHGKEVVPDAGDKETSH